MFKYLVIFWNEEENVWAIFSWHTTKERAEALFKEACKEFRDVKLVSIAKLKEQNL